jgi:L-threonylcarbamoyladenylate synthase
VTRPNILRYDRKAPSLEVVVRLRRHLGAGGLAVIPTETQYALTADATSAEAVRQVRTVKGRAAVQPMSVFLANADALADWRIMLPDWAHPLAKAFWPGPLTLVLRSRSTVFRRLGAPGSVGVRVSPEPIVKALTERMDCPLIATSANPSGTALSAPAENLWLSEGVAKGHFLWTRPRRFQRHVPSTVLDCCGARPKLIRAGAIPTEAWRRVLRRGT